VESHIPAPSPHLKIGLIVNPIAGLGGSLALKGSDNLPDSARLCASFTSDNPGRSMQRAGRALRPLLECSGKLTFVCPAGNMGQTILQSLGFRCELLEAWNDGNTTAEDTRRAALALKGEAVDIIVFTGGDGTARDIYDALGDSFPVLGIPAGVKMHSGVFAVSPEAAGELLLDLVNGGLVDLALREVRDIDEQAFREDLVRSRFYGEMLVPAPGRYLQQTKVGGVENSELAAAEIAAWVVESMADSCTYILGPGSTTAAIMTELGLPNTLLGVDVIRAGQVLLSDASEEQLLALLGELTGAAKIIVTAIGGQGHIFGRGNQQISSRVIRRVGIGNIQLVAAKSKITALQGRPLLLDTNSPELDLELSGYHLVITGYRDQILYRLATMA